MIRSLAALLVLSSLGPATTAEAADPAGKRETWEGTLKVTPDIELRLVFHVVEADGGKLSATMDSPDQGATGLSVDSVTRDKTGLVFELKALKGKFEGKLNAEGTEAAGTWTQGPASLPLTLRKVDAAKAEPAAVGKEEVWEGKLIVKAGIGLRMVVRASKTADGTYVARLDSPDEGLKGLKLDPFTLDESQLAFGLKATGAKYEGKLNAEGTEAVGSWSQSGVKIPLTFKKTDAPSVVRRPQTPKPPFPYRSEDVSYENKAAGVTLAGTLTTPEGPGPFPALILISGSGAQDRDETIFQHKPFLVLADALTRRGVAVLRVDDRGVGGSTGSTAKSTSDDFAGDVLTGLEFLKGRPRIDPKAIGLIGHSEGGLIAPVVATRSADVAFIVLLAGTGLPGDEILYLQGRLILKAMGAKDESLARQRDLQRKLFDVVKAEPDPAKALVKLREVAKADFDALPEAERKDPENAPARIDAELKAVNTPWFRHFLTFDPRPILSKVRCPVLALVGEKDLQVPPKENLSEIERVLKAAGNTRVMVKELPGLNHLFQTCKTGAPSEYAEIEETIAQTALNEIGDWVVEQVKRR
jgi:pimeloyl-ACP methyl ester carboxylesterase